MKVSEFLGDNESHSHCAHCPHVTLTLNEHAMVPMLIKHKAEHFNAINTILHLMRCHPEIFAADVELAAEVKSVYGLEL